MSESLSESRTTHDGAMPRSRVAAITVGIVAAAIAIVALFAFRGSDANLEGAFGESSDTSELTGVAYAESIGLIAHPYDLSMKLEQVEGALTLDGVALTDCVTPANGDEWAFSIVPDGGLYCYSAPTEIEVWIIGQRLAGHVPTDQQVSAREAEIANASED